MSVGRGERDLRKIFIGLENHLDAFGNVMDRPHSVSVT